MKIKRARRLVMSALAVLSTLTVALAVNIGSRMRRNVVSPKCAVETVPRISDKKVRNTMVKGKPVLLAEAGNPIFAPSQPIIIKLTLMNETEAEIYLVETSSVRDNELEIRKSTGEKLRLTEKAKKILESPILRRIVSRLGPGQKIQYEIDAGDWYDLTANSDYILTVKRRILLQDRRKFAEVESNPIRIMVQP